MTQQTKIVAVHMKSYYERILNMKRILAISCIVILVALYVITLIAAIIGSPASNGIFMAAVSANVILPVMMWVYLQTAKFLKKRGEKIREENN